MARDNSEICHEGDEFFDVETVPNRKTVASTEDVLKNVQKGMKEKLLVEAQKAWLHPDNPFLWSDTQYYDVF